MMRMKQMVIPLLSMSFMSALFLLGLSVLAYILKWQADIVLVGITFTYITIGFIGGKVRKRFSYETNIGKKLMEGIMLGTIFMLLLVVLSLFVMDIPFSFTTRFLMIWMLIVGSTALGRVL